MKHLGDNLFIGRRDDGTVELKRLGMYPMPESWPKAGQSHSDCTWSMTLSPERWAAVVAFVTARGDTGYVYRTALRLHQFEEPSAFLGRIRVGNQTLFVEDGRIVDAIFSTHDAAEDGS